ncbi:uncharacterized protein FTOL_05369 [Fusarium torulosum]|uniref:Uncharacterized protein n=1 Tax=Fusarium torulosum TaxID=33205 RepID=A0AAE8M933_9HYPO|nr:uncharacterized protein FTOL_05369 [Fusarium torulosum]
MVHSPDLGYLDPPRREQPGDPGRGSWGYPSLASSRRILLLRAVRFREPPGIKGSTSTSSKGITTVKLTTSHDLHRTPSHD